MENFTGGLRFKDFFRGGKLAVPEWFENEPLVQGIARELSRADRGYQLDNLDPSTEGNYLVDFMRVHGDDEIFPVEHHGGTPHCAGEGLLPVDVEKKRRQLEDRVRKGDTAYLYRLLAVRQQ